MLPWQRQAPDARGSDDTSSGVLGAWDELPGAAGWSRPMSEARAASCRELGSSCNHVHDQPQPGSRTAETLPWQSQQTLTCCVRQLAAKRPVFHWEKGGVAGRASGDLRRCSRSCQKRVLDALRHLRHWRHTWAALQAHRGQREGWC